MRHLVLGGARSGKSRHALLLASAMPAPHVFVATAQAWDAEMEERIAQHREERDLNWQTVEAPLDLPQTIEQARAATLLVDCCTLWLSNVMLAGRDSKAASAELIDSLTRSPARIMLVSNEVGSGIVPETALGRRFRDEQGRLNQRLAEFCDTVELVVAGLPVRLKG